MGAPNQGIYPLTPKHPSSLPQHKHTYITCPTEKISSPYHKFSSQMWLFSRVEVQRRIITLEKFLHLQGTFAGVTGPSKTKL